jgi:hypothetical protein
MRSGTSARYSPPVATARQAPGAGRHLESATVPRSDGDADADAARSPAALMDRYCTSYPLSRHRCCLKQKVSIVLSCRSCPGWLLAH